MDYDYLVRAIHFLRPGSEFSFTNSDYATIKWDVLEGTAPTQLEIDEAIKEIKIQDAAKLQKDAADKLALLEKLGITEDQAKLLLS